MSAMAAILKIYFSAHLHICSGYVTQVSDPWPVGLLFSLYIYIENFKNLLVRNHWTNFNIILQKCSFGDPLPRLFKPFGFVKKHGRQGQGLFSLYICIENFKNHLVRNHWTDFNIILQKCSFGDPLPRLFKPFGFVKKHGRQGAGLIFPIYLYRKL